MPYIGLGLHIIIALFFAVHAVRSQQNTYWLIILFTFPGLGSLVYFLAIYLPEIRHSRHGRATVRAASQLIDPHKAIRLAAQDFDRAPTIQHRMRLAHALFDAQQYEDAAVHYRQAVQGPYADDPDLLKGLARAEFAIGNPGASRDALEKLFAAHPGTREQSGPTLLHARTLAATQASGTREAFERAIMYANDAAARCLYAEWLQAQPDPADHERAMALFNDILNDARHLPRHAQKNNREWMQRARTGLGAADRVAGLSPRNDRT
ncbi:tetratricopeptide repeat protein [Pseudomonadota bacterium AL_CKDN230030165-1A_HGKHYDSX7]